MRSENRSTLARQRPGSGASDAISSRARAIEEGLTEGSSTPVRPDWTTSHAPPVAGAITGTPQASASAMTIPNSSRDGQTSAVLAR
jgi:hypothetical protein